MKGRPYIKALGAVLEEARDIASASGTEDPGSNPARV
jgi:hypothetical protein